MAEGDVDENLCTPSVLAEAITEIFNSMVFMEVGSVDGIDEDLLNEPCVMGMLSFTGAFDGSISICCSSKCAKEITMNLLAFEDEEEMESSDIPDAIGEVTNMTMGALKTRLYDQFGELAVSVPTVVRGAALLNELRAGEIKLGAKVGINDQYMIQVNFVYIKSGEK
jgi:CheY-specific phosphatase CheX